MTPNMTASNWAETPKIGIEDKLSVGDMGRIDTDAEMGSERKRRSRWDITPVVFIGGETPGQFTPKVVGAVTPVAGGATPTMLAPGAATPVGVAAMGMRTPAVNVAAMLPEQLQEWRYGKEIDERNKPFTDEELDVLLPPGYKVRPCMLY